LAKRDEIGLWSNARLGHRDRLSVTSAAENRPGRHARKNSFLGSFLSDGEKARHLKAVDA